MAWLALSYPLLSPTITLSFLHLHIVLVRVDDTVCDPTHKAYVHEVSKACGLIEYRQFRLDWLNYQRCHIDVVAFCKKTKLLFRGDK